MTKRVSNLLYFISFFMTVLIVFLHALFKTDLNTFDMISNYIRTFCDCAVPTFFTLSAFFLFKKSKKSYKDKIVQRLKTLVLPYFIWSSLFYILYFIISRIPVIGLHLSSNYISFNFFDMIKSILFCKYVPQLWYIRILFEIVIISWVYYAILKKNKVISLLIPVIILVINFLFKLPTVCVLTWLPLFWFVSWITYNYEEKIYSFLNYKNKGLFVISVCVLIYIYFAAVNSDIYSKCYFLWRLISPLLILIIIFNLDFKIKIYSFYKQNFFIFVNHYFIILIFQKLLLLILPINLFTVLIIYIISSIFGVIIPIIEANIIKRISKKMYNILSGERG